MWTARTWFHLHGYLEINPPTAVRSPALEEHLFAPRVGELFLHTSPEFALKRVLAKGLPRVYSICPCFREEEWGPLHTSEFTMVEWYRAGCGYREIMDEVEELVTVVATQLDRPVPKPFRRMSYADAYVEYTGKRAPEDGIEEQRVWVNDVEPHLIEPTFIVDYPAKDAAFAATRGDVSERFELFINGVELANAFSELLNPDELLVRWTRNNRSREESGRQGHPIDERVLEAVARHPRAGGVALGFDRLLMVLLGLSDIREIQIPG